MKKNIWILGGSGYIGMELVKHLSFFPDNRLHLLVHQNIPYYALERHSLFSGNLKDFDWTWLEKYPPTIIFHLARMGGSNILTRNLAASQGARANERMKRFLEKLPNPPVIVYVSGSLMYGPQKESMLADEFSTINPVSYARYYIKGEEPWLHAQSNGQLDVRFARPGWIVGKGSWLEAFYLKPFFSTGIIPVYGDGKQLMSLIHLEDCARQIVNLGEAGNKKQNLNVFAGLPISQREFAELLAELLNARVEPIAINKMRKLYGQTVTEALTSSIPMTTSYPQLHKGPAMQYPDANSIVKSILSFFENKQGILTKTPQISSVQQ